MQSNYISWTLKTKAQEVPDEVRKSSFGCPNCLWNGCECRKGSKYITELQSGKQSCKSYTYYN